MDAMTQIFIWSFLSYGLMNIIVFGSIFSGFRDTIKMFSELNDTFITHIFKFIYGVISCPMCFSTWGGFFLGLAVFSPTNTYLGMSIDYSWFFDGIFSSGVVWTINSIVEWFEENRRN